MKKNLVLALFLLTILFVTKPAEAHFLAIDHSIGAVLHVDPNDQPVAGSQTSFFLAFKDKQNKFAPQHCDCTFEIDENGKSIYSQPLFQNDTNPNLRNASLFYTFPQIDVYQVKVIGKPLTTNTFQPFTLTWTFRVDQNAYSKTGSTQNTHFFSRYLIPIMLIGILFVGLAMYGIINTSKKRQSKTNGGKKNYDEKNSGDIY